MKRIAIVGSTGKGDYGHALDEVWGTLPEAEVVAVADDDADGRARAAKKLGVAKAYADYRKMLDETRPDIVAVCPRWIDRHGEMALAAAERGVHVYIEKPFCRTLAEADAVVDACERTHARLAIAHPTRYSPRLATVRKLLAAGAIGRVVEYRGRGKEDRRGGGEDLWVLGSHVMDMIRYLAGHPAWCFAQVEQAGEPVARRHVAPGAEGIGPLAGDTVRAIYGMPDGSTAYFSSYRNVAGKPSRYGLRIYGSHGIIEILEGTLPPTMILRDRSWASGRSDAQWQPISSAGVDKPEPLQGPPYDSRHQLAVRDLLAAIEAGREPLSGMYEARGATEMIVAVFESHRQGRAVPLPLENRENPLEMLGG